MHASSYPIPPSSEMMRVARSTSFLFVASTWIIQLPIILPSIPMVPVESVLKTSLTAR